MGVAVSDANRSRPAGLSGWLAVALVVATIGGIGVLHGRATAVALGVLAAGTSAAGVELGERAENRYVAAGSLCLSGGALLVVGAIALALRTDTVQPIETPLFPTPLYVTVDALLVLVLALSVFTASLAQRGVFATAPRRGLTFLVAAAVPTGLLFGVNSLTGDALALTGDAVGAVASFLSAPHTPGLWPLFGSLAVAAFGASAALEAAPLPAFLADAWHERVDDARRVLGPRLRTTTSFALLGALLAGFMSLSGAYEPVRTAAPGAYAAAVSLGTSVALRYALLGVGVAGVGIATATKLLRHVHAERLRLMRPVTAMAGGVPIAVFVAVVPVGARLRSALERYDVVANAVELVAPPVVSSLRTGQPVGTAEIGLMVATAGVVLVLAAWGGVFVALWFGRAFRLLPRRGSGFAAAAAGVPEGPAFGRLSAGEAVEVDGGTVTPDEVTTEERVTFAIPSRNANPDLR